MTPRFALSLSLLLVGCQQSPAPGVPYGECFQMPPPASPVVARIGAETVSMDDIYRRVVEQGSFARQYANDPEKLRQLVEDQVRLSLLSHAAVERRLHRDPEVIQAARKVMVRKLLEHDLGPDALADLGSESRLRSYYNVHKADYQQPEKRRLMHIQLKPTPEGRALAQQLIASLRDTEDRGAFQAAVTQHTQDHASRSAGGELPFYSRDELIQRFGQHFADEVFSMQVATLAQHPVQSTKGWHVVALLGAREARRLAFEEAKPLIRERLYESSRGALFNTYLEELKQQNPIAIYDDRMDELQGYVKERLNQ